jgi:hypothetical protein
MSLFCQTGYTLIGGTKCLKIVTTTSAWATAETACGADGGTLATITSSAQNAAVIGAYSANVPFWIGFTDSATEGTFLWVDGTPTSYTNWYSTEPDNTGPSGSPANCVIVNTAAGQWYDRPCGDANRYLCQTRPITCQTGYTLTGTKCTKLVSASTANWATAEAACVSNGGTLVTFSDSTISAAVYSAYSASIPFWIGFTDAATEGTWLWVDGTPTSYTNWYSTEPDNTGPSGGPANCGIVNTGGQWYDRSCNDANRYVCQTPQVTSAPTYAPSRLPTFAPTNAPTYSPTFAPTTTPTLAPTTAPSSEPTSAPTISIPDCGQFLSFDDSHGTYETWMTSFLKYEGNFAADDDDDFEFKAGYIPFMTALDMSGVDGVKPAIILAVRYGPGATFSVVPGKLDSHGSLMPCEVQAAGSGPCFTSHSWEMGLTAKSLLNSVYSAETSAWIAPYGSSMTNECFPESEMTTFTDSRLRPAAFTGEGRSHNNVRPPSFHAAPAPLPHESVELSLTMRDGRGFGWWNTLKFHPNQYVLDNGEEIVHRGTLVDKAEDTHKVRLL